MKKRDIIIARNYNAGVQFVSQNQMSPNSIILPCNWHNANVFHGMNSLNFHDIWITVPWMEINEHLRFQIYHQAFIHNIKLEDALRFPIMRA